MGECAMAKITITIPDQFLQPLDELVMQTGAGNRETWVKNVIGQILVDYQLKKDLAQQIQQRTAYLASLWG
jgi:metal-responsive CopG/Arc/MetJ family transcriptional regulator